MMKKRICIVMSLLLCALLSFAGCSGAATAESATAESDIFAAASEESSELSEAESSEESVEESSEAPSEESSEPETPSLDADGADEVITGIMEFTWNWFYDNPNVDHNDVIEADYMGRSDFPYEKVVYDGVSSIEDFKALASEYYTEDCINTLMEYKGWLDQDGALYTTKTDGLGGMATISYNIWVEESGEGVYTAHAKEYNEFGDNEFDFTLSYVSGHWISDTAIVLFTGVDVNIVASADEL